MAHSLDRRTFLTSVGLASTGLAAFSTFAAEKEVRVGIIGAGSRGTTLLERTLVQKNVQVTAICDIREDRAMNELELAPT